MNKIDKKFVEDYVFNAQHNLEVPKMGGTDWRFTERIAPAFYDILDITKAENILEIGFNVGGSALMFLSIKPDLAYFSVDINRSEKSIDFLAEMFLGFYFTQADSKELVVREGQEGIYDLVFIDGDHTPEGVTADINVALKYKPAYILFDDVRHPSHSYIEKIITEDYADKLEVVKMYEFNDLWEGYSMALCKVKNNNT